MTTPTPSAPQPSDARVWRHPVAWLVAACCVALVFCLPFGCLLTWTGYWVGRQQEIPAGGAAAQALVLAKGKPDAEWGWQDLQDHLAAKGMKTNRGLGRRGMWFMPGDGNAINRVGIDIFDTAPSECYTLGGFRATDYPTTEEATREMRRVKDIEQRDVLAWRRFLFDAPAATQAKLKELL